MSVPVEPESFRTDVECDFLDNLVEHATQRFPALENAQIMTGWAGVYEITPAHQGIIGESRQAPGLWLCCGFPGHVWGAESPSNSIRGT